MDSIDLQETIEAARLHGLSLPNTGKVASYIPELAKADPEALGICIVANNKKIYKCGDCETLFSMQSISKVMALVMALEILGEESVFKYVGVEPTGDAFNSIVRLETNTFIPYNPMINAGAIVIAGMLREHSSFEEYLEFIRKLSGRRDIYVNEDVYNSENETGMKNRSIAYLLANEGVLCNDVEAVIDFYFKMCSVEVNTVDLARMASVLANDGIDVITGERLINPRDAIIAKTIMITCGLYDGSGEFALNVGIPSKSGVSGGIMSCVNGNFGIGVYSPALNFKGNSVLGIDVLKYLSNELGLHSFATSGIKEYI